MKYLSIRASSLAFSQQNNTSGTRLTASTQSRRRSTSTKIAWLSFRMRSWRMRTTTRLKLRLSRSRECRLILFDARVIFSSFSLLERLEMSSTRKLFCASTRVMILLRRSHAWKRRSVTSWSRVWECSSFIWRLTLRARILTILWLVSYKMCFQ